MQRLLNYIRRIQPPADYVSDRELIRQYREENRPGAFELLVRRHANAVWTACVKISRHEQDAEDAFQATFIALSKSFHKIKADPSIAGWLYRVAVNAALRVKKQKLQTSELPDISANNNDDTFLISETIYQSLSDLPEQERLPILLCDLQGHTREQTAQILGWPIGSVHGRLSRARERLKTILAKRGITSSTTLAVVTVPPTLILHTTSITANASQTVTILPLTTLAQGALSDMGTSSSKWVSILIASLFLVTTTGAIYTLAQKKDEKNAAKASLIAEPSGDVNENSDKSYDIVFKKILKRYPNPEAVKIRDVKVPVIYDIFNKKGQNTHEFEVMLFPEIIELRNEDFEVYFQSVIKKYENMPVSDGRRKVEYARIVSFIKYCESTNKVIQSQNWDTTFLNDLTTQIRKFQTDFAASEIDSKHIFQLYILKMNFELLRIVKIKVEVAHAIRPSVYFETMLHYLESELEFDKSIRGINEKSTGKTP
jgi:RNA polymerase sigma factor (sigma-70 family)